MLCHTKVTHIAWYLKHEKPQKNPSWTKSNGTNTPSDSSQLFSISFSSIHSNYIANAIISRKYLSYYATHSATMRAQRVSMS